MATASPITVVNSARPHGWLPLAILPATVLLLGTAWPPWVWMWALAVSIYIGLKWLSYAECSAGNSLARRRSLAYLLLWPGMDASAFLSAKAAKPQTAEWIWAFAKIVTGITLVLASVRLVDSWHPLAAGWIGMVGIVFSLHFGLFHVVSLVWRQAGIDAKPIMDVPVFATSVSDFWGRRWNRAFRDLSHRFVYCPINRRIGPAAATWTVFLVSGVVHDLVISVPARGGWGLPTAYFMLQAVGLFVGRSKIGQRFGLRRGVRGRLFAAAVVILPVPLLFHTPFLERVVIPMLEAIGVML